LAGKVFVNKTTWRRRLSQSSRTVRETDRSAAGWKAAAPKINQLHSRCLALIVELFCEFLKFFGKEQSASGILGGRCCFVSSVSVAVGRGGAPVDDGGKRRPDFFTGPAIVWPSERDA